MLSLYDLEDKLKLYGIDIKDKDGNLKSLKKLLNEIGERMAEMENEQS